LTRHEKLHTRAAATKQAQSLQSLPVSRVTSFDTLPWDAPRPPAEDVVTACPPGHAWETSDAHQASGLQATASDLDFALIWPDSENLFQSIMSSDTSDQWQIPLGALPVPPVVQDISGMNFGSPNSFDDRASSIGTIPSGGSHQAVRDVSDMVTSSVCTASLSSTVANGLLVLQRYSCDQGYLNYIRLSRRMPAYVLRAVYPHVSHPPSGYLRFS
jgi:hypothetical protein